MEEKDDFLEEKKKARKAKNKAVRPWKGLTFLNLFLAVISIVEIGRAHV